MEEPGVERVDGCRLRGGVVAQALHELDGAHAGEVDVDQDRFGLLRARELESMLQVERAQQHEVPAACEELLAERDTLGVVLHAEQAAASRVGFGNSSGHHETAWHGHDGGTVRWSA